MMAAKQIKIHSHIHTHTHVHVQTNPDKRFDLSRRMTDGKSVGWMDGSAKKPANERRSAVLCVCLVGA